MQTVDTVQQIPLTDIRSSIHQARKTFEEKTMNALAESMRHEGLIQPITVRPLGVPSSFRKDTSAAFGEPGYQMPAPTQAFELVSGERRLRAAKMLGWQTIPCRIIQVISEGEAAAKGLVENLQREDLNPIEEAEGFAQLNKVDSDYWTQERIAQVCGKDRTYVTRSFSLLSLAEPIKDEVRRRTLSRSHAIEIARLPSAALQQKALDLVLKGLKREEARLLVDQLQSEASDSKVANKSIKLPSEGLGHPDPIGKTWDGLSQEAAHQQLGWKTQYQGNWRWRLELDFSKLWAATAKPISQSSPQDQQKRIAELKKTLAEWLEKAVQRLAEGG